MMFFWNYRLRKKYLDKCLKSVVLENYSTSNMVNGPDTIKVSTTAALSYLLITVKAIEVEKISLSDMQNHRSFC